jgi:hypothetical protein
MAGRCALRAKPRCPIVTRPCQLFTGWLLSPQLCLTTQLAVAIIYHQWSQLRLYTTLLLTLSHSTSMPPAISTSALPETLVTSLITHGEDKVDVSSCLNHLYVPHAKYSRLFGRKLRWLGKGVMLRGEQLFQPKP